MYFFVSSSYPHWYLPLPLLLQAHDFISTIICQDTTFSFSHLFYTHMASTNALCGTGKLTLGLLIDQQLWLKIFHQETYSSFLKEALIYKNMAGWETFSIFPLYSVQLSHIHWSGRKIQHWSLKVMTAAPRMGRKLLVVLLLFGSAAAWQSVCDSRNTRSGHYLITKSHTFLCQYHYLFLSEWEGNSTAGFNAPGTMNLRFHSGNESWPSCLAVGQNQTIWYLPLMHKANK